MKNIRTQFRVPASTANLGAGFDALSLALDRYLTVSIEPANAVHIEAAGVDYGKIPLDGGNLICRVASSVAQARGRVLPEKRISTIIIADYERQGDSR